MSSDLRPSEETHRKRNRQKAVVASSRAERRNTGGWGMEHPGHSDRATEGGGSALKIFWAGLPNSYQMACRTWRCRCLQREGSASQTEALTQACRFGLHPLGLL
ncbi:hypothetical protein SKAU_G00065380 [Synaphobranchus kaupii]|uniref:Uncharacterized protein n=1 Tax=Synaphobranchus kaupii TaxID=118154 RepID=A0A9Q1G6I5_SYNKA|nr:hypothetical protein SKAU_G00065380 [Synaphobranchus kaupii]